MRRENSHTAVAIDGKLALAEVEEVQRVHESLPAQVSLGLGGLDACVEEGIRILRDWLNSGATLTHAAPFLRVILESNKGQFSRKPTR